MAPRRPPSPRAGCHRSAPRPIRLRAGQLLAAVLLALVAAAAIVGAGQPAGARPAQDPTFTTDTVATTTTTAVGATTVAASGTDADGTTTTSTQSTPPTSSRILTESRKIMAIVGGLVLIALAMTLLTIRYWRQTKPVPVAAPVPTPAQVRAPAARREEPELTRAERRAAEASESGRRRSRRAVAGADHAGADDDWEPRGTGEHERVVIDPRPTTSGRPARPSRAGREAVLRRDAPSS